MLKRRRFHGPPCREHRRGSNRISVASPYSRRFSRRYQSRSIPLRRKHNTYGCPGMVSPGPKQETRQNFIPIPQASSTQRLAQVQRQDQIARPVYDTMQRGSSVIAERQRERFTTTPAVTPDRAPITPIPTFVPIATQIPTTTTIPESTQYTAPRTTPIPKQMTPQNVPQYSPTPYQTPPRIIPPTVPTPFGLPGFGGVGGATPGARPRRAAFMETFALGLDISLRGRRTIKAKSLTSPKKYKRTATAKKKGGKK